MYLFIKIIVIYKLYYIKTLIYRDFSNYSIPFRSQSKKKNEDQGKIGNYFF